MTYFWSPVINESIWFCLQDPSKPVEVRETRRSSRAATKSSYSTVYREDSVEKADVKVPAKKVRAKSAPKKGKVNAFSFVIFSKKCKNLVHELFLISNWLWCLQDASKPTVMKEKRRSARADSKVSVDEDHSDNDKDSDAEVPVKKGRPEAVPENNRVRAHFYIFMVGYYFGLRLVATL